LILIYLPLMSIKKQRSVILIFLDVHEEAELNSDLPWCPWRRQKLIAAALSSFDAPSLTGSIRRWRKCIQFWMICGESKNYCCFPSPVP
jgi:hypothetical protein